MFGIFFLMFPPFSGRLRSTSIFSVPFSHFSSLPLPGQVWRDQFDPLAMNIMFEIWIVLPKVNCVDINKLIVLNLYFDLHVCTRECHKKIQRAEARMNILPANLEKLSNDQLSKDMQRSIWKIWKCVAVQRKSGRESACGQIIEVSQL